ncbi:MAG: hypothetical protein E7185_09805 [Erysipelotrichaceae bacterium]|nr:hypothetical protein [Erysipelotrichaceae bacterium]
MTLASGAIERKYLAHYINCTPSAQTATYERIGKDLEEYNVELNAEVEKKKNILGETSIKLSSYEVQGTVEPFYAEIGSDLFTFLQDLVDNRKVLDAVKTDMVEVHTWETPTSNAYPAIKEEVYIEVTSYGGDTTGYQIPFNVHYTGKRTSGTFNPTTKAFAATGE